VKTVGEQVQLSDQEIKRRLGPIRTVETLVEHSRNHIIELGDDLVLVQSEKPKVPGEPRSVRFDEIRRWESATSNSSIVRTLARILGYPVP